MDNTICILALVATACFASVGSQVPPSSLTPQAGSKCTNPEIPSNCICQNHPWGGPEIIMTCKGLEEPWMVLKALRLNANVVRLHLVNCILPYLPLGIAPHSLSELHLINGSIQHLSPPLSNMSAFDGLNNLTKLIVKGMGDLSHWDWRKLSPLKNLQLIHVEDTSLPSLPASMSSLGGGTEGPGWTLNLTNTMLLHIAPSALTSIKLRCFVTRGNPIRTLSWQMHQANKGITALEIVGTKITQLDANFLSGLERLDSLVTDAYFLSYMSPTSFNSGRTPTLHYFAILGEPVNCSCRYSYLLKNGLRWKEECVLSTSTHTAKYLLAEFLNVAC